MENARKNNETNWCYVASTKEKKCRSKYLHVDASADRVGIHHFLILLLFSNKRIFFFKIYLLYNYIKKRKWHKSKKKIFKN